METGNPPNRHPIRRLRRSDASFDLTNSIPAGRLSVFNFKTRETDLNQSPLKIRPFFQIPTNFFFQILATFSLKSVDFWHK